MPPISSVVPIQWWPSPHFCPGRKAPVELVILHAISLPDGVFGTGHVIDFFMGRLDPRLHPSYEELALVRVSSHFFVERDGRLHQFVDTEDTAWHAGESCFGGRRNCNDFSIGIELEGDRRRDFTAEQYRALTSLCAAIRRRYPVITADRIVGHSEVSPGRKWDPGPRFDWERLRRALAGLPS
jgi:AmpD protein